MGRGHSANCWVLCSQECVKSAIVTWWRAIFSKWVQYLCHRVVSILVYMVYKKHYCYGTGKSDSRYYSDRTWFFHKLS